MKNPVSRTAYYTLGVRAWDASLPNPVCGDSFAKVFMDDEAKKIWAEFKDEARPNASNAARHAIIDKFLQQALNSKPDSLVVIVGAGFDTRAFRLKGGRWIEVDEPAIIQLKETVLPSSNALNKLTRIDIDFAMEKLVDKLSVHSTHEEVHVIVEGVLMYLNGDQRKILLGSLKQLFPTHVVYCDLMVKSFFNKYSRTIHEKIVSLGASFSDLQEQPENLFLENGYSVLSSTSVPLYAAEHGNVNIPAFVIRYFMKTLRNGYRIWRFRHTSEDT
jgi:methyltransferase (TIGR00027 family)